MQTDLFAMLALTDVLTSSTANTLIKEILAFLQQKRTSKKDKAEMVKKIAKLVNLSNNTGQAISCYMQLLKNSTEASVHSTELRRLLKELPKNVGTAQLEKFEDVRFQRHLRKEGIELIHQFREDYESASRVYAEAERHLECAINDYRQNNDGYNQEIEHLTRQLDELVVLATRRIDEFIEGLREAYKVLESIK
jgi:hypothetical protein